MIQYQYQMTQGKKVVQQREGYMESVELDEMFEAVRKYAESPKPSPPATISCTIQRSLDYGEIRCSFTVSCPCPATSAWMEHGNKALFALTLRWVNDAFQVLAPHMPRLKGPNDQG